MATHETFAKGPKVEGASDRSFGLTVGGILSAIAIWRCLAGGGFPDVAGWALLVGGGALVALGLTAPALLAPLNRAWTYIGYIMFRVISPIVMFLIYVLAIVPVGLLLKALGRDLLRLKLDPVATSYWIKRAPPGPDPAGMVDQF